MGRLCRVKRDATRTQKIDISVLQWLSPHPAFFFFNKGTIFFFNRENYAVGLGYIVILEVSHCG